VSREPAADGDMLRDLVRLCTGGDVYAVERWIQEGQPIQALTYKRPKKPSVVSPLRAAIRRQRRNIVLLLLCNGYRLDLESEMADSVLDEAMKAGAFEILELLLKWGADPTKAAVYNVIGTYRTDLIDRFWRAGLDYTKDSGLVPYLASTVNKPLYGWLRRNRADQRLQDALDLALVEAVTEDEELPTRLLLWAGADPHRMGPPDRDPADPDANDEEAELSAAETAILYGRHRLLDLLRIDKMPDLERQVARAGDSWTLQKLVALRPPSDWSDVILTFIRQICWDSARGLAWDAREALKVVASKGGRLTTVSPDGLRYLRGQLLNLRGPDDFHWLLKWLKKDKNCEPAIYAALIRTSGMRKKIAALAEGARYLTPSQKMSRANERRQRVREQKRGRATGTEE